MITYHSLGQPTDADVAQSVERRLGKAEVTGPIPVISFIRKGYLLGYPFLFTLYRTKISNIIQELNLSSLVYSFKFLGDSVRNYMNLLVLQIKEHYNLLA